MEKNITLNKTLKEYNRKYSKWSSLLLHISKKEVEEFDKQNNLKNKNYLLKNKNWWLINDTYYEVPKKNFSNWLRGLSTPTKVISSIAVIAIIAAAIAIPVVMLMPRGISIDVPEEIKENLVIKSTETIELGKPCNFSLSLLDTVKEAKQLPSKIKEVKTGNKVLPLKESNDEEENYYTYNLTEDRCSAGIYINKIEGNVSISLDVENRDVFTISFNTNGGSEISPISVKRGEKVTEPTKPTKHELVEFTNWTKEGEETAFNFETPVTSSFTLNAHYKVVKTGVIIKGINFGKTNNIFYSMQDAYDAGNAKMKYLSTDLNWGTCSKEKYLEVFNDITIDEQNNYKANITWELYTKDGEELVIPAIAYQEQKAFFYSFGRRSNSFGEGDEDKLFIYNTTVIGADVDNKPKLKYTSSEYSLQAMIPNFSHTNNRLPSPVTFKNINFDDSQVVAYLIYQAQPTTVQNLATFYLTIDGCDFVNRLVFAGHNRQITVKNCTFVGNSDLEWCLDFWNAAGSDDNSENLIFENNKVKNYRRGVQLNSIRFNHVSIKGNTFSEMNVNKVKLSNGAIQLSAGNNSTFDIEKNTFDHCYTNCFKFHEDFTGHAIVNINENTIKDCGYVGVSEKDKTLDNYTLTSKDNEISNTAKDKAGNGVDTETTDKNYIIVLNEK